MALPVLNSVAVAMLIADVMLITNAREDLKSSHCCELKHQIAPTFDKLFPFFLCTLSLSLFALVPWRT